MSAPISQKDCSICLDEILIHNGESNGEAAACGHVFHRICLQTWLKDHNKCPLCNLTAADVQKLAANEMDVLTVEGRALRDEFNQRLDRRDFDGLDHLREQIQRVFTSMSILTKRMAEKDEIRLAQMRRHDAIRGLSSI